MKHLLAPLCGLLVLSVRAPSQDTAPAKAPQDPAARPVLRIHMDGPALLRQKLLPTNLGSLLAGEQGQGYWDQAFRGLAAQLEGSGLSEAQAQAFAKATAAYRGRVSFWVFPGRRPRDTQVILLVPDDGQPGYQVLHKTIRSSLEGRGKLRGAAGFTFVGVKEYSLPHLMEGGFALAVGGRIPLVEAAELAGQFASVDPRGPFLQLQVDPEALREQLGKQVLGSFGNKLLGTKSWRELEMRCAARGPHLVMDLDVAFGQGHRGMLGALFRDAATPPQLQQLIPAGRHPWVMGRFGLKDLVDAGIRAVAEEGFVFQGPTSVEQIRKQINTELGIDLHAELLDRWGDRHLVLGAFRPGMGADRRVGLCFCVETAQAEKILPALRKVMQKTYSPTGPSEVQEHAGVKVEVGGARRSTWASAATGKYLLFSFGQDGLELLRAVLQRIQSGAEPEIQAAIRRSKMLHPAGLNGMGVLPVESLGNSAVMWFLRETIGMVLPGGSRELPIKEWLGHAKRLRIDSLVWYSGHDQGRHLLRLIL